MDETSGSSLPEKPKFVIKIGEAKFLPVYEPVVPREITDGILAREQLPHVPELGSSIVEDFIIRKLQSGDTTNQAVADEFFSEGIPGKAKVFIDGVKDTSSKLDWEKVFNQRDISQAQAAVLLEMRQMGMTAEQIQGVAAMKPVIAEGIGVSSLGQDVAFASRLQAVRRAIDYVTVYGDNGVTIEDVARVFLTSTIGHELGHKVDDVAGIAINRITPEWIHDGEIVESKSERFAEYWGQVPLTVDRDRKIKETEWLVQLTKTTQVWDSLAKYNSTHPDKVDLFAVFRGIKDRLKEPENSDLIALMYARQAVYMACPVENYASPYTRDKIQESVMAK